MKLIVIQGGGASGKSTLANKISSSLGIPTFLKDDYKEKQYDLLNKKLNFKRWLDIEQQSYEAINNAIELAISSQKSLIVEGNFPFFRRKKLKQAVDTYSSTIEIDCYARPWIAFTRFIRRAERPERHKGHKDRLWYPLVFLEAIFSKFGLRWYRPLRLSGYLLVVDTSSPADINYEKILRFINKPR